jgi:type IV pilus secretin PilQ/predicted competence protein
MGRMGWRLAAVVWSAGMLAMAAGQAGAEETVPTADDPEALSSAPEQPAPIAELSVDDGVDGAGGSRGLSMEFQDANLGDVLKTFSKETGINIIAGEEISDRPITVFFEQVSVLDALDQILRAGDLVYERPPGSDIYVVKAKPEDPLRTITRVYRLRYARVSESILAKAAKIFGDRTPFETALQSAGSESGGGSSGGSGGGGSSGGSGGSGGSQAGVGIDTVLKKLLTKQGEAVVDSRTNSLIVTDVPENFPRIEAALAALDTKTKQIMVDAEVIETTLTKLKDLGFEWGTGSEGILFQLTPARRTTQFPWGNWFGNHAVSSDLATDTSTTVGTLDTSQAVMALQALQTDTDTKVLARPKVLTLDNESAVIRLTTDETIGFETTTGEATATTTSTPERETTGVLLIVTPQVNEGNYITMIVEPSVTKTVASLITPPTNQAATRDPKTRSSRTLVRIRSGDTLVVGGLIDRSEQDSLRQVPILSGIPFFGEAFKNTEINDTASELIVFVTPRILSEPGGETQVASAPAGSAPFAMREQEKSSSRQSLIEQTLNKLEQPQL